MPNQSFILWSKFKNILIHYLIQFRENEISIIAQIKEKRFKSVATPYMDDYYKNGLTNNANKMDNVSKNYSYSQNDIKSHYTKNINLAEANQEVNKTNSSIVANLTTNMGKIHFYLIKSFMRKIVYLS